MNAFTFLKYRILRLRKSLANNLRQVTVKKSLVYKHYVI